MWVSSDVVCVVGVLEVDVTVAEGELSLANASGGVSEYVECV